jgi:hypothetical protein
MLATYHHSHPCTTCTTIPIRTLPLSRIIHSTFILASTRSHVTCAHLPVRLRSASPLQHSPPPPTSYNPASAMIPHLRPRRACELPNPPKPKLSPRHPSTHSVRSRVRSVRPCVRIVRPCVRIVRPCLRIVRVTCSDEKDAPCCGMPDCTRGGVVLRSGLWNVQSSLRRGKRGFRQVLT